MNNWHYGYGYNRPIWDAYNYGGWYGAYNPFYAPAYGGFYGRPVYVIKNPLMPSTNVSRPALGGYSNKSYGNSNNRSSFGDVFKKVITPSNNSGYNNTNSGYSNNNTSSRPTYEAPSRTYNPPASSSSSSGSGSGSSEGPISRPARGNN
jgi:hypothetical protein